MAEPMDDKELISYLAREIEEALNEEDGDVSEVRQRNFDRYYGKLYGDEEPGKSKFTTRETFEAVEWAIPSVLRYFTGSGRSVEFEPLSEEDERRAQEETDVVNHIALQRNDGFLFLYGFVKNALMYPNAYIKVWVDEKDVVTFERLEGVTEIDLAAFEANPETDIVEATGYEAEIELVPGQPIQATLYDIRVKITKREKKLRIENLPPDEALISDSLYSVNLDEADFVCHRRQMTVSELVQMGHDADEVIAAGTDDHTWNDERVNRLFYEEESPDAGDDKEGASKLIWVHECYANVDFDGDDIAEKRRILLIGAQIFENEETSYQPLISSSAIIMPNKHTGMSYIEAVDNLQLVSTVLTRQMLDNVYAHTDKRVFIDESALMSDNSTIDNYLDGSSSIIPVQGSPHQAVMPEVSTPIIQELLATIDHFKDQTQMRTGVAPELSLDPSVLKESTMGAFMGALEHASQRLEVLVRIIAETAIKPIYLKVHYLSRQFLNDPVSLKIRGNWLNANPSEWVNRDNVTVKVGLGHQNKQAKMAFLAQMYGIQKEEANMATAAERFNTLETMIESAGVGSVSKYFIEPSQENIESGRYKPPQPPPPDPVVMGQLKALMMDTQARAEKGQADTKIALQKMQADSLKWVKEMDLKLAEAKRATMEAEARIMDARERLEIFGHAELADVRKVNRESQLTAAQTDKTEAQTEEIRGNGQD